ncbi:MAG TPA: hypothetical protein ACHBX6_02230 [Arsenophonus nasoniae]|uniref:hypothetical protein n=1 Tax=Arsenophonus nasoniae TaxID=638 RepID=UPI003879B6C6
MKSLSNALIISIGFLSISPFFAVTQEPIIDYPTEGTNNAECLKLYHKKHECFLCPEGHGYCASPSRQKQ